MFIMKEQGAKSFFQSKVNSDQLNYSLYIA